MLKKQSTIKQFEKIKTDPYWAFAGGQFLRLKKKIDSFGKNTEVKTPEHERIDYWFKSKEND